MAKIKKGRIGVKLDMTPLVDVAFLLLTFFMLTTQFRPPEEVQVTIPESHSTLKLPVANVITLTVTRDEEIWMDVDAQIVRAKLFGMEYAKSSGKQVKIEELPNLVNKARFENIAIRGAEGAMRVVIKGDKDSDYEVVGKIIMILQKNKISTINFITNIEESKI